MPFNRISQHTVVRGILLQLLLEDWSCWLVLQIEIPLWIRSVKAIQLRLSVGVLHFKWFSVKIFDKHVVDLHLASLNTMRTKQKCFFRFVSTHLVISNDWLVGKNIDSVLPSKSPNAICKFTNFEPYNQASANWYHWYQIQCKLLKQLKISPNI